MADVSLNFRQNAYYAEEQGGIPICLVTIDHEDFSEPIRISTDPTERLIETATEIVYGTTSNSNDYYFFPCDLKLPDDTDDGPGDMRLSFDNVNRDYIEIIRNTNGLVTVQVDMVLSNALDTIEVSWPEFEITNISYDAFQITGTMRMETMESDTFPAVSMTPKTTQNLF